MLWFPLISAIISRKIGLGKRLIVALDRTQWKKNNILMVSAIIEKRAWPIYWLLLEKEGASNFGEQEAVLRPIIRLFRKYKLIVIGDREFQSIELAEWLQGKKISFVFRQKKATTFRQKRQKSQPLKEIVLSPGMGKFYEDISLTKNRGFKRLNLAVYWKRKYKGKQEKEPWYLLTNLSDLKTAVEIYKKRFGIEAMFKDCKTGGYNLEDTQVPPEKLSRIILLIALAMTSAWLLGKRTVCQGKANYICRPQEEGRNRKRHSNFWIGLYGSNWLTLYKECQELVEEFMGLNLNKQAFYQRGLNAMKLIDPGPNALIVAP